VDCFVAYCQICSTIGILGKRAERLTHGGLVRASAHVQARSFLSGIRSICPFAQIHQVQAVPLLDAQLSSQLVCNIVYDPVQVAFDCAGDVFGEAAEEGAD
jgi:hypothetical protein